MVKGDAAEQLFVRHDDVPVDGFAVVAIKPAQGVTKIDAYSNVLSAHGNDIRGNVQGTIIPAPFYELK